MFFCVLNSAHASHLCKILIFGIHRLRSEEDMLKPWPESLLPPQQHPHPKCTAADPENPHPESSSPPLPHLHHKYKAADPMT